MECRELLDAIIADPACDTKRLVYADWLEDHDEPEWAARIRRKVANPSSITSRVLWESAGGIRIHFRRGFVYKLSGLLIPLLEYGPSLISRHPVEEAEASNWLDIPGEEAAQKDLIHLARFLFINGKAQFSANESNKALLAELLRRANAVQEPVLA